MVIIAEQNKNNISLNLVINLIFIFILTDRVFTNVHNICVYKYKYIYLYYNYIREWSNILSKYAHIYSLRHKLFNIIFLILRINVLLLVNLCQHKHK